MNVTSFRPKRVGNVENKSYSPVNIRFFAKTSNIRISLKTTDLMLTLWRPAAFGDFRKKTPHVA